MLDVYLIMGHNTWTPWVDKDTICTFLVENSNTRRGSGPDPQQGLGSSIQLAWKRYNPQNTQESFGTSINCITFSPVSTILFLCMPRKCCLEKAQSLGGGSSTYAPAGIHTPPPISEERPGLIAAFGTCLLEGAPHKTIIALRFLYTMATRRRHV